MRAAGVVLAAGTGRRLAPLTDYVPKPLLPILDRPLIEHQVGRLEDAGVAASFANLHHHASAVSRHLERHAPGVIHREEPRLSGPAGALSLFAEELRPYEAVLVVSSDVVLGEGLESLLDDHVRADVAMTFGVVETTGASRFGVLDLDATGAVVRAREKPPVPDHETHLVSAGVYCLRSDAVLEIGRLAERLPTVDFARDLAPALLVRGARLGAHRFAGYWRDVGTPDSYRAVNRDALGGEIPSLAGPRRGQDPRPGWAPPCYVHPRATVEDSAALTGPVVVGAGARVGEGARIADTVVLPGAVVPPGAVVLGGVFAAAREPTGGDPGLAVSQVAVR